MLEEICQSSSLTHLSITTARKRQAAARLQTHARRFESTAPTVIAEGECPVELFLASAAIAMAREPTRAGRGVVRECVHQLEAESDHVLEASRPSIQKNILTMEDVR